jgi:formylglycine-generating enzyme required for sulfatase activity
MDFEDKAVRHSFILDALKWQNAKQEEKEAVKGFFSAYEDKDAKRLRGVLKQISFSKEFTPDALDSMIYMAAPPAVAKPEPEKPAVEEPKKTAEPELAGAEIFAEAKEALRGERGKGAMPHDGNRLVIGGMEFLKIPKGKFIMGSKDDNEMAQDREKPQHTVDLSDYWMAKFILTNQQFAEFAKATNYRTTAEEKGSGYTNDGTGWKDIKGADWKHPLGPKSDLKEKNDHPVVLVSWEDASAYCKWFNETRQAELKEAGNLTLRLPTEAEWEKAARGAYGNEWPWGNEFDPNKCNSAEGKKGGTTPVGAYSSLGGDSPYGCADMVGNVWEWCADWYDEVEYKKRASGSVVDPRCPQSGNGRVLRGGSFNNGQFNARCAYRFNYLPDTCDGDLGFRVCASFPSHI